ncbi:MAG: saccharopine dehydrogenase C-terminal domain-containing protein [Ignavibacteria bacterium]|jgi:saccharopine dehydrogenase (NADP+, L-glutamate forming)
MKKVLVVGAGRSAISLISYLINKSEDQNWKITVADQSIQTANEKTNGHPNTKAIELNVNDSVHVTREIAKADIVVSLVPPELHIHLVKYCMVNKKHFVTASYVSEDMRKVHGEASKSNLIFLNEMGLDPGIDHMDTMRLLSKVKKIGGKPYSLKSYCGGLITPESDNNPWGYKITWNPMSVLKAGSASAKYLENGRLKIVPYNRIFLDTQHVDVPGLGKYESYPNRDSLKYKSKYNLPDIPNIYRGSLRKIGFCAAWNALVQIGLTDNSYFVPNSNQLSYREWLSAYLDKTNGVTTKDTLIKFLGDSADAEILDKLEWLGILSDKKINVKNATPADILFDLITRKWDFKKTDRDMIVLQTEVEYELKNNKEKLTSSLIVRGDDYHRTAMAKTVGMPLGIGVNLILNNKIKERGVMIPTFKDIYMPALKELSELGIEFKEQTIEVI